jgi:hypothetical protein
LTMLEENDRTLMGLMFGSPLVASIGGTVLRRSVVDRMVLMLTALAILTIAVFAWVRPVYNWDMVAYFATALEDRIHDPDELHARTWAEIEQGARDSQVFHLKFSNPYNLHQWENPEDFQSQLSMYRVKIAYVTLLRWLEPITGLTTASLLLSILPSVALGFLSLWWLARNDAVQGAVFLFPFLVIAGYVRMTVGVVPDMLLSLISLAAVLALARGRDVVACILLFSSVLIRPDNIILVFAILIAAVLFGWRIWLFLITFVAGLGACILISKTGDHPGWWAHFVFSNVQIQNSMVGFAPEFSLLKFLQGYARGVTNALMDNAWPALLLMLVGAWALLWKSRRIGSGRENALIFALAIGTLGKFASFPLPDDRFYFTFTAIMALILVCQWKPRFDFVPAAPKADTEPSDPRKG